MSGIPILWTIGHSNHTLEAFARLLAQETIEFVADVRSYPYSRHASQFNREDFRNALAQRAIRYVFLGEALGEARDLPFFLERLLSAGYDHEPMLAPTQ